MAGSSSRNSSGNNEDPISSSRVPSRQFAPPPPSSPFRVLVIGSEETIDLISSQETRIPRDAATGLIRTCRRSSPNGVSHSARRSPGHHQHHHPKTTSNKRPRPT
ncbi:hypothetical protein VTJ04DRAFT_8945 [Mycothermus thermophilus]|uniref:uncharacterized protein n=1 Tax=Humicola insolens TaxID=85995 RepID=UPI0037421B90